MSVNHLNVLKSMDGPNANSVMIGGTSTTGTLAPFAGGVFPSTSNRENENNGKKGGEERRKRIK
jgi:hypothetical protein